ncbi:hypothetical protein D3C85_1523140 [compost metagenome]
MLTTGKQQLHPLKEVWRFLQGGIAIKVARGRPNVGSTWHGHWNQHFAIFNPGLSCGASSEQQGQAQRALHRVTPRMRSSALWQVLDPD